MSTRRLDSEVQVAEPDQAPEFKDQLQNWMSAGEDEDPKDHAERMRQVLSNMGVNTGESRSDKLQKMITARVRGKSIEDIQATYPDLRIDGVIEPRQTQENTKPEEVSEQVLDKISPAEYPSLPVPEPVDEATANHLVSEFFDYKKDIDFYERRRNIKELKQRLGLKVSDSNDPDYLQRVAKTQLVNRYGDGLREFMESRLVPQKKEPKLKNAESAEAENAKTSANRLTQIRNKLNSADRHNLTDAQYLSLYTELKNYYEGRAQTDSDARMKLENVQRVYGVRANRILSDFEKRFNYDIPEGRKDLPKPDDIRGLQLLIHNGGTFAEKLYAAKILTKYYTEQAEQSTEASKKENFQALADNFNKSAVAFSKRLFGNPIKPIDPRQVRKDTVVAYGKRNSEFTPDELERQAKLRAEFAEVPEPEVVIDEQAEKEGENTVAFQEFMDTWAVLPIKIQDKQEKPATDENKEVLSLPLQERLASLTNAVIGFTKRIEFLVKKKNKDKRAEEKARTELGILAKLTDEEYLRNVFADDKDIDEVIQTFKLNQERLTKLVAEAFQSVEKELSPQERMRNVVEATVKYTHSVEVAVTKRDEVAARNNLALLARMSDREYLSKVLQNPKKVEEVVQYLQKNQERLNALVENTFSSKNREFRESELKEFSDFVSETYDETAVKHFMTKVPPKSEKDIKLIMQMDGYEAKRAEYIAIQIDKLKKGEIEW